MRSHSFQGIWPPVVAKRHVNGVSPMSPNECHRCPQSVHTAHLLYSNFFTILSCTTDSRGTYLGRAYPTAFSAAVSKPTLHFRLPQHLKHPHNRAIIPIPHPRLHALLQQPPVRLTHRQPHPPLLPKLHHQPHIFEMLRQLRL